MKEEHDAKVIAGLLAVQSAFNRDLVAALVESGAIESDTALDLFSNLGRRLRMRAADRGRNPDSEILTIASEVFEQDRHKLFVMLESRSDD